MGPETITFESPDSPVQFAVMKGTLRTYEKTPIKLDSLIESLESPPKELLEAENIQIIEKVETKKYSKNDEKYPEKTKKSLRRSKKSTEKPTEDLKTIETNGSTLANQESQVQTPEKAKEPTG